MLERPGAKFCNHECYSEACKKKLISNRGWFRKGQASLNKGRTLESWVGVERAREIKARMSLHSKAKGEFLKSLNLNREYLDKRRLSRQFHDHVVLGIIRELRQRGLRCYVLSEYVKEDRTPDAIIFDGHNLVAMELELVKRYKPSEEAIKCRLEELNSRSGFFDKARMLLAAGADLEGSVRKGATELTAKD